MKGVLRGVEGSEDTQTRTWRLARRESHQTGMAHVTGGVQRQASEKSEAQLHAAGGDPLYRETHRCEWRLHPGSPGTLAACGPICCWETKHILGQDGHACHSPRTTKVTI